MDRAIDLSRSFASQSITLGCKLGQRVWCTINTECFTAIVSYGLVDPPFAFLSTRKQKVWDQTELRHVSGYIQAAWKQKQP